MSLIIPGVEISVIRELVPRPLGATGILGIAGCTELDYSNRPLQALGSLQEFRNTFGAASLMSMPEVAQAFTSGLNQVVVANIPPESALSAWAEVDATCDGAPAKLKFTARASGAWGNQLSIRILSKTMGGNADEQVELQVYLPSRDGEQPVKAETLRNLSCRQGNDRYFVSVINKESGFLYAEVKPNMGTTAKVLPNNSNPTASLIGLAGGEDPNQAAYQEALSRLETYPEVDMVTVSHCFGGNEIKATAVYADVLSHCDRMSRIARNRIGFGQTISEAGSKPNVQPAINMAGRLPSDRFILVAPYGYMGSVIGMIAGLRYFDSPTFKSLGGVSDLSFDYTDSNLIALITAGVCAVDEVPRKGIACVKGITTDTGQINVTRIADRAVRQVQNIAQDFIGLLNTEEQRLALKQRIIEAFTRMEKEGAIVPSTDGKSPAFAVSVESTPDDFAAGIVRIGTAVRPVRAIDYIYATVMVQAF